jgi:hypothetical protein
MQHSDDIAASAEEEVFDLLLNNLLRYLGFACDEATVDLSVSDRGVILSFESAKEIEDAAQELNRYLGLNVEFDVAEPKKRSLIIGMDALKKSEITLRKTCRILDFLDVFIRNSARYAGFSVSRQCRVRVDEENWFIKFRNSEARDFYYSELKSLEFIADLITIGQNNCEIIIKASVELPKLMELVATQSALTRLCKEIALTGRLVLKPESIFDDVLDEYSLIVSYQTASVTNPESNIVCLPAHYALRRFESYLKLDLGLISSRDYRVLERSRQDEQPLEIIRTQGNRGEFIHLTANAAKALRKIDINIALIEATLEREEGLKYFQDIHIERMSANYGKPAVYRVYSHHVAGMSLAQKFLSRSIGLDVGENVSGNEEDDLFWLDIEEEDLNENAGFLKGLKPHFRKYTQITEQIWRIKGISRMRLRKNLMRIRCDGETLDQLASLKGFGQPRVRRKAITKRAFSNRVFFSPWKLYGQLEKLKLIEDTQKGAFTPGIYASDRQTISRESDGIYA